MARASVEGDGNRRHGASLSIENKAATSDVEWVVQVSCLSWVSRPAVFFSSRLSRAIAPLPFVISTGAKRSGEICGSVGVPWKCFGNPIVSQ